MPSALEDVGLEHIDAEADGVGPELSGLLNLRGDDADMRHAREDALTLVAAIDAVFFRRPDFQQDAETVARVKESDSVPWLVGGKNVRRRGDLLQAGGSQVCNVIDDVRGVQANVVERADAAARLNEAMHSCALCRCGVQFKFGMADGNINDVCGVCATLLTSARQGRAIGSTRNPSAAENMSVAP